MELLSNPNCPLELTTNIEHLGDQARVIIVDVDGVVFDNTARLNEHLIEVVDGRRQVRSDADHEKYHAEVYKDVPTAFYPELRPLSSLYTIVFVTARPASDFQEQAFLDMLQDPPEGLWFYQFQGGPYAGMSSVEYKRAIVRLLREHGVDIVFAIDDSLAMMNMYKDEGVCALRCHDHIDDAGLHY